jgi:soluble lytic murein transglycosylase-like protein
MAAVYLADDQPNYAHWIMKKHIDETGPGYHNLREWGVAFPTDFMELAHKYGAKYGVSPFLVQAIIRQESGFRPGVSSYAGAMGLMQLMPGTARYTQRQFLQQGGHLSRSEIVRPETNVKLGTMYIRIHTAFAADQIPLALAGYNAGPAPLESWFERYGERELDAWVESITYREARGYVRKVFTSYVTYAGLYGSGELPKISLEMPEKLREWGDVPEVDRVEEGEPVSWVLD